MWVIKYWKFIAGGIAVLSLLGGLWYYGHTKYQSGAKSERAVCEVEKKHMQDAIDLRDRQIRDIKKGADHEVQSLNRNELIKQLCANGWVRNADKCPAE